MPESNFNIINNKEKQPCQSRLLRIHFYAHAFIWNKRKCCYNANYRDERKENMQGNELCLKASVAFSGTRCLNRTKPHSGLREVFQIRTVFTQSIQKSREREERKKKTCTPLFFFSHVSQAEEPTEQCVSETMRSVRVFPSWSRGVNWLWRDPWPIWDELPAPSSNVEYLIADYEFIPHRAEPFACQDPFLPGWTD